MYSAAASAGDRVADIAACFVFLLMLTHGSERLADRRRLTPTDADWQRLSAISSD